MTDEDEEKKKAPAGTADAAVGAGRMPLLPVQ